MSDVVVAAAVRSSAFEMTAVVPTTDYLLQTPNMRGARTSDPAPATRPPTHFSAASMWRTSLAHPAPLLRRLLRTADVILHSSGSITTKPGPLASHYGTPRSKTSVATNYSLHILNVVLYQNLKLPSRVEFVLLRHILRPLARLPTYRSARGKRILLSTYFAAIRAATTRQERGRCPYEDRRIAASSSTSHSHCAFPHALLHALLRTARCGLTSTVSRQPHQRQRRNVLCSGRSPISRKLL